MNKLILSFYNATNFTTFFYLVVMLERYDEIPKGQVEFMICNKKRYNIYREPDNKKWWSGDEFNSLILSVMDILTVKKKS